MILSYLAYKFLKGLFLKKEAPQGQPRQQAVRASGEDLVEDPFCHTYIPMSSAVKTLEEGKTIYFCSNKCLEQFKALQEK
jgi:YHS domain-containing protein